MGTESVASTDSASRRPSLPRDVIKLVRFFIFNSSFGPREGEEAQRIIFYHSDNEDEETEEQRTKQVGLAEAVVRFSSVFSDMPCESLHTQKTKSVFYEPEPGYVILLAASVPCFARRKADGVTTEYVYHPENVHDNVLLAILRRGYEMFHFFTGGFERLKPHDDKELFCRRVSTFFSRYVSAIHLERQDVSDLFQAVHFLTMESSAFLQVQSFVHRIEDEFPCIDTCAFFHQGFVAWSGLQQTQTSLLYHYIYSTLLPSTLSRTSPTALQPSLGPFSGHQGHFLTGPPSLKDPDASLIVPRIFVPDSGDQLKEHHLVVYHALNATLCLIIPCEIELCLDFFRRLDAHLGPRLTHMSADLHNVFGRNSGIGGSGLLGEPVTAALSTSPAMTSQLSMPPIVTSPDGEHAVQFMYFNSFNRAMKSTLPHVVTRVSTQQQCDDNVAIKDASHVISDLELDFTRIKKRSYSDCTDIVSSTASDISVKLPNDSWVVGKVDGQRHVFALVQSKNANLIDVGEEVDKMMMAEFKNICILDK